MPTPVHLNLSPEQAADPEKIKKLSGNIAGIDPSKILSVRIIKRSIDARKNHIRVILSVEIFKKGEPVIPLIKSFQPVNVTNSREVLIIWAGPAGLFAALSLIELGIKPVIIERGKDVSSRKKDIARINREHIIDPDSNYCFGEGGAGTFSDGKLYTRSKKRGDNNRVLELLCFHGAPENVIYEAHPHIGSDKLPRIISSVRQSILDAGGTIMFGKRVTGIITGGGSIKGIILQGGEKLLSPYVILAAGHSSRDIYSLCISGNIMLEMKSFAMGVRIEHPQELIDRIQYHGSQRGDYLPAASYNLVRQVDGRGVYSFCMCPGGFIVPSATSQEEVVVNGMSPSDRNTPFANSGIVVEIRPKDIVRSSGECVIAGIDFQEAVEHKAWMEGGKTQKAPSQRLTDFVNGKFSASLPKTSYFPGITSSPINEWLPEVIGNRLREGIRQFDKIMKGYLTQEAVVLAVESRTSSPVRILRDPDTMENVSVKGLYPCGEGSGYTGGIVSSAVDGMRTAEVLAGKIGKNTL